MKRVKCSCRCHLKKFTLSGPVSGSGTGIEWTGVLYKLQISQIILFTNIQIFW